ncbi:unnamed protein product [Closterium sp. NIES-65]|nr:unnamed protein product [Closterium sp. NIES-65]
MYALEISADGDCYLCVLPDPGIEASTLGAGEAATLVASESALSSTTPDEALHTFTLHSGPPLCFVPGGSVWLTVRSPPPLVLDDLVSNAVIQDHWVDTFSPGGQRVAICTCSMTGRHLATFARQPGSSLYTPTTVSPQVAAIGQVSASGQVASPCERRSLSHQTLLWHHRLGHPSLPRLRGMHRRLLVSGLPRSLPPLPASPAPPYLPCVEGLAALRILTPPRFPYRGSSADPPPGRVGFSPRSWSGRSLGSEQFVLRLRRRFPPGPAYLRLHSDRGGEFSSDLLRAFYQGEGMKQSFTLLGSVQQNGFAERRIGLVFYHPTSRRVFPSQDVTFDESVHFYHLFPYRTAPLPPPPLFLTAGPPPIDPSPLEVLLLGAVLRSAEPWGAGLAVAESRGAESVREVLGVRSLGVLSLRQAREWLASRTRQRSRAAGAACRGGAGSAGVSGPGGARTGGTGAAGTGTAPRAGGVGFGGAAAGCTRAGGPGAGAVDPGINDPVAGGAGSGGVDSGGAGAGGFGAAGGAGAGGADAVVTGAGGAATGGVGAGGSGAAGGAGAGGAAVGVTGAGGAAAGGAGAGGSGAAGGAGVGGVAAGVTRAGGAATRGAGAGDSGAAGGARARGAATGVTGARGAAAGGSGAAEGSGAAGGAGATGTGGTAPPRLFLAPLSPSSLPPRVYVLRQVLSLPSSTGLPLKSGAPLPAPSPYTEQTNSLTERREPPSRPASPVRARRTDSRVPPERPPPVPGTRAMALRPSSVLQRVPLPSPPASSLPDVQNP